MLHCTQKSLEVTPHVERKARKGITVHYRGKVNIGAAILERRGD